VTQDGKVTYKVKRGAQLNSLLCCNKTEEVHQNFLVIITFVKRYSFYTLVVNIIVLRIVC